MISKSVCHLRILEENDLSDKYLFWLNDPEVTRYLEVGKVPVTRENMYNYWKKFNDDKDKKLFAIIDNKTALHIGNVNLEKISPDTALTGIMIGDKPYWNQGYATEAWKLLISYARKIGLRKLRAGVVIDNFATIKVFGKLGFKQVGSEERKIHGGSWMTYWFEKELG